MSEIPRTIPGSGPLDVTAVTGGRNYLDWKIERFPQEIEWPDSVHSNFNLPVGRHSASRFIFNV